MNIHQQLEAWRARDPQNRAYDIDLNPEDIFIEVRAMYGGELFSASFETDEPMTWVQQQEVLEKMLGRAIQAELNWRVKQTQEVCLQSAFLSASQLLKTFGQGRGRGYTPYLRQLGAHV
jgi:hypothetical protein